jgi:general stress protein 26
MKDHLSHSELTDLFWDRLDDVPAGMLAAEGLRPVPMAHIARRDDGAIWFISAAGTPMVDAAQTGSRASYITACSGGNLYARVDGTLAVERDANKVDELWSPFAAAWFEEGRKDDDVRLLKFTPIEAEVWGTDGQAKFLYEIAKGNLTDSTPDAGVHGTITF